MGLAGITITNQLTVTDGQVALEGQCANVVISADGILKLANSTSLSGDFSLAPGGTLNANTRTVTFNGTGLQTISGTPTFVGLTINNTAASPDDSNAVVTTGAVTTTGHLAVTDGQFMPLSGSAFRNVSIGTAGILKPVAGATMTITGDNGSGSAWGMSSGGQFIANGGLVRFASSGGQLVTTSPALAFYDVEILNTAATPSDSNSVRFSSNVITATNQLTVTDGQLQIQGQYADVNVSADGILKLTNATSLSGDFSLSAGGTFNPNNASVTFNGTALQTISGSPTFVGLTINNTAASPDDSNAVVTTGAVTSTGQLTVTDGQFTPGSGSAFRNISIGAAGILKPASNATISITGASSGTAMSANAGGQFLANGGRVRFTGSSDQVVNPSLVASFNDVEVANTAAAPDDSNDISFAGTHTITGELLVSDGQVLLAGATVNDLTVNSAGIAKVSGTVNIGGNLSVDAGGSFLPNGGTVNFTAVGESLFDASAPIPFAAITLTTGTLLNEIGNAGSSAAAITNPGVIRRSAAVGASSVISGGLTGTSLTIDTTGTLAALVIDRIDSVPNGTAAHNQGASWTFNDGGATGYAVAVTLPHAIAVASDAVTSRYLGTGTDWDYVQDSFTATTVTRSAVASLANRWAVAEVPGTSVTDWMVVGDE